MARFKQKLAFFMAFLMLATMATFSFPAAVSAEAEEGAVVVACVGDSITKGERSGDLFRYSYPAWLQSFLGSGYKVLNFGWGGATARKGTSNSYWEKVQYTESHECDPDIVIVMLGTNDVKDDHWIDKATYKADLKELVEEYQDLPSTPTVYIANCAWALTGTTETNLSDYGVLDAISEVAEELDCTLIDIHAATADLKGIYSSSGTNLHPTAAGYRYIARVMQAALTGTGRADDILNYKDHTGDSTFRIYDEEGWLYFAYLTSGVNFQGKTILLENDLDFEEFTHDYGSLVPVGPTYSQCFAGTLNGQGHRLFNVRLDRPKDSGLICYLGGNVTGAAVRNLIIASGEILGGTKNESDGSVSSLAARCYASTIENVLNAASVTNRASSGHGTAGLCAMVNGSSTIRNAVNFGAVTTNYNLGGVAAAFSSTPVFEHCFNGGTLSGSGYACVRLQNESFTPTRTDCCYDNNATQSAGGCTAVAHADVLSGAVAAAMNGAGASMAFSDDFAVCPAFGDDTPAAMVTVGGSSVCLKADGTPNADPATPEGQVFGGWTHAGAVYTADNHAYTQADLNAVIAEGRATDTKYRAAAKITALNNALTAAEGEENAENFATRAAAIRTAIAGLTNAAYPDVPTMQEYETYPNFTAYRLTTVEDVQAFGDIISAGESFSGKTVYLMNHLDFTGIDFKPLGATIGVVVSDSDESTNCFKGTLEGNGYSFNNVHIHSMWLGAGLFPILRGATIRNFGVLSGSVEGYDVVGGFSGYCDAACTLRNVWSGMDVYSVSTANGAAGFCANMRGSGKLINAICWGTVSGTNYIAGLVAWGQNAGAALQAANCCFAGALDLRGGSNSNTFIRYNGTVNGKALNMIGFAGREGNTYNHNGYTILDAYDLNAAVAALNAGSDDEVKWQMVNGYPGPTTKKEWAEPEGLVNTYAYPDIKSGLVEGEYIYKVTDRAGMDKISALINQPVADAETFEGYTFYQAADIDMNDLPFNPIGHALCQSGTTTTIDSAKSVPFKGTFDGNGYVLKNLAIMEPRSCGVGLFGFVDGATIKNVGIDGGLIVGLDEVGGVAGWAESSLNCRNCWNSATVCAAQTDNNGAGGIVGRIGMTGTYNVINCYNLGVLFSRAQRISGILGWSTAADRVIRNCYNYGQIISRFDAQATPGNQFRGYVAITRTTATNDSTFGYNNYFRDDCGQRSYKEAKAAGIKQNGASGTACLTDDGGVAKSAAQFTTLASELNGAGENSVSSLAEVPGYTVEYTDTAAGYPVLTYSKGGVVRAQHVAAAGEVYCADYLGAHSAVMQALLDHQTPCTAGEWQPSTKFDYSEAAVIGSANDLIMAGLVFQGQSLSGFGVNAIIITDDIDWNDQDLFPGLSWGIPLISNSSHVFNGTLLGNNHVVRNWKSYGAIASTRSDSRVSVSGGFIGAQLSGVVRDFGLINAKVYFDLTAANSGTAYTYGGIIAGYTLGASYTLMKNCFVTGDIYSMGGTVTDYANNASAVLGRIMGDTSNVHVADCWGDCTLHYFDGSAQKCRAVGSSQQDANAQISNVRYVSTTAYTSSERNVDANQTRVNSIYLPKITAILNQSFIPNGICWNLNEQNEIVWGDMAAYPAYITRTYNVLDSALFTNSELATLQSSAAALAERETPATQEELIALNAAEWAFYDGHTGLANISPNYVPYSKRAAYQAFGIVTPSKNYSITTKEDWIALVNYTNTSAHPTLSGITIHLTNDIDMEGERCRPLCRDYTADYTYSFKGTLDGHDHVFKNINIEENITNIRLLSVGLVGNAQAATIKNLGIESGSVIGHYAAVDGLGVGGIVGLTAGSTKLQRCWTNATVTAYAEGGVGTSDVSVGGITGRGMGNTIIDNCYNIGAVTGPSHVSALNDWTQKTAKTYNSFNAGTITSTSGSAGQRLARTNETNSSPAVNTIFANDYNTSTSVGALNNKFTDENLQTNRNCENIKDGDSGQYTTGELAYKLNTKYMTGCGTQPYYKVVDGKTVFATAADQTRKVTITGAVSKTLYLNTGESYNLGSADLLNGYYTYSVTTGDASKLTGSVLTMDTADMAITATASALDVSALQTLVDGFGSEDYYNSTFAAILLEVRERLENNWYIDAAAVTADIARINGADQSFSTEPEHLPSASEYGSYNYSEAPAFAIRTPADLVAVRTTPGNFTTTLYLLNDLDMSATAWNTPINNLTASFNGMNHTISNLTGNAGLFTEYKGAFIRNLVIENAGVTGGYARSILIAQASGSRELTIENITIKGSTLTCSNTANKGSFILSYSDRGTAVAIRDVYIYNSRITCSETPTAGQPMNIGFILGCPYSASYNLENIVIEQCRMDNLATDYSGIAFISGGTENGATLNLTNAAVINCTGQAGSRFYAVSGQDKGDATHNTYVNLNNVLVFGNSNIPDALMLAQFSETVESGATKLRGYLTAENVYTDLSNAVYDNAAKEMVSEYEGVTVSASAANGELVYNFNALAEKNLLAVSDTGNVVAVNSENKAPVKITLIDQDGARYLRYTDAGGALLEEEPELAADVDQAFAGWSRNNIAPIAALPEVFTEDSSYTAKFATANNTVVGALEDRINMSFKLDLGHYEADHVRVIKYDENGNISRRTRGIAAYEPVLGDDGRYVVDVKLAPAQLKDEISIVLIKDGEEVRTFTYSAATYLTALKGLPAAPDTLKDLCNATLAYGAAAQVYFNYNADNLADEDYMAHVAVAGRSTASATVQGRRADAGLKAASVTAAIESGVALHFYFTPADTPAESYTFTLNGNPVGATMVGGRYLVEVYNIAAADLGTYYTVEVNGAYRVQYSAMCYAAKMQLNVDTKVVDLVNGMKLYYDAAVKYFA